MEHDCRLRKGQKMSLGMEMVMMKVTVTDRLIRGVGAYTSTVNKMFYPFAKPQDCGNLTGVKWIRLDNETNGTGMLICGNEDINASALHFMTEQLDKAKQSTS